LDGWWVKNAGLAKDVDELTAYQLFLAEIFGRMTITDPPGSSSTAVKAARRKSAP
jgi:hypothetical protein